MEGRGAEGEKAREVPGGGWAGGGSRGLWFSKDLGFSWK